MFCIHCGTDMPATAEFCPGCGRAAGGSQPIISADSAAAVYRPVYAGFWLRLAASIVDSIVLMPVALILLLPLAFLIPDPASVNTDDITALAIFYVVVVGISMAGTWLYHALMESSQYQATLGKKVLNLKVTDMDGRRISFGRATGRFFSKSLSSAIFNIGFLMAGFTEKKQALHDMLASCLVVRR